MDTSPQFTTQVKLRSFTSKILYFNGLYKLPIAPYPTVTYVTTDEYKKLEKIDPVGVAHKNFRELLIKRLLDFRKTLEAELNEVDHIVNSIRLGVKDGNIIKEPLEPYTELDALVDIADWLNDIIVYCSSESAKFGIPSEEVLSIIMSSNFSKLDANGAPIYDNAGKVLKGPMYWKPEPQIKKLLQERIEEALPMNKTIVEKGIVWRTE
jgi:hypothetical protein